MRNGDYNLVIAPEGYPGAVYRGRYASEHTVVWWQNTGYIIDTSKEMIHHKNRDKRDNRFENLEIMSRKKHNQLHFKTGRTMIKLRCAGCGEYFNREKRSYDYKIKKGQKYFYCCVNHLNQYNFKSLDD